MTEHLPECHLMQPCGADTPKHGFCSRQQTSCIHCERECICDRLQACEARVTALATPESVSQANYWYEQGQQDFLKAAVQRIEALRPSITILGSKTLNWPLLESMDRNAATDAIKGE